MRRYKLILIMLIISLFVFNAETYAQCAGSDNTTTICNKETYNQGIGNPNGVVNLFNEITGVPLPGGTWSNLDGVAGFNATTGILNTNQILQGGIYNFQYTVTGIPGCTNNTAIITIVLNGYAGFSTGATLCSNDSPVNLFTYFNTFDFPSPDINGNFTIFGNAVSSTFNPSNVSVGSYNITYTTSSVGGCPVSSTSFTLTVAQAPNAGIATPLRFCETDNLSAFTNVNLFNQLTGEDTGGIWQDVSGTVTGEISNSSDSFINIQNIYNNFGAGTYVFRYTVNQTSVGCFPSNADVAIIIEPVADINGANLSISPSPICFNNLSATTLTGTIIQGANPIPNGTYNITYVLSGANSGTETVSIPFSSGSGTFVVNPAFVNTIGLTTVNISSIINSSSVINCTRTITNLNASFEIFENPDVSDSQLMIDDFCLGQTGQGNISDSNAATIQLLNGTYTITYTITGPNGTLTGQTATVTISNGSGPFSILSSLTSVAGNYSVTITNIQNQASGCASPANITDSFVVSPIPDAQTISVMIDDICFGNNAVVQISGATNLINGFYNLTYDSNGAINVSNQTETNVQFSGGNASFTLPTGILVLGNSTVTITSLVSVTNTCNTTSFNNPSDSFEIKPLPDTNGATITASDICISETEIITIQNATSLTDGDYTIIYDLSGANTSNGNQETVSFLNGNGEFTIPTSLLQNGGTTTITIQNLTSDTTSCGTSNLSTNPVSFVITDPGVPTLITDGNIFCIQDIQNPTIANLTANITSTGTITWYDATTGGNPYNSNDAITNGTTYYASLTNGANCEGISRLEVTVDLTNCPNLFIPDGFSPNGDGLNDTFYIKNLDVIYPNFVVEIYNRYGNMVYSGNINTPNFEGKANQSTVIGNDVLPTGVYFYILHYNDLTNKKPTQGRLYLSR